MNKEIHNCLLDKHLRLMPSRVMTSGWMTTTVTSIVTVWTIICWKNLQSDFALAFLLFFTFLYQVLYHKISIMLFNDVIYAYLSLESIVWVIFQVQYRDTFKLDITPLRQYHFLQLGYLLKMIEPIFKNEMLSITSINPSRFADSPLQPLRNQLSPTLPT